jgi:CPA2 family monovalent cation:H+ antiporter-2
MGETILQAAKAFGFLLVMAIAARYGTRLIGRLIAVRDNELLVISFLGAAILVAGVSEVLGVVDAIGAFMVGLILAGTPSGPRIRRLVHPLRDAFAAIFFLAFGLAINPADLVSVAGPVAAAVALTIAMNVIAGLFAARLYRHGPGPTANIATTLLGRGEFALILAAMAATAGLDGRLAPFIASYVLVLAVLGPVLAGRAHLLARVLEAAGAVRPRRRERPSWEGRPPDDREPGPPDDEPAEPSEAAAARSGTP